MSNCEQERTHPRVWARIKKEWLEADKAGVAGKWNARKAQLAVKQYKRECEKKFGDSGYKCAKKKDNSLAKWSAEKWDYVDRKGTGRYLPEAVRKSLSPAEARAETQRKRGKKGKVVPYTASVNEKMRRAKIY